MNYLLISEDCTSKKLELLGNYKIPYNKIIVFKNDHFKYIKNKIGSRKSLYFIDQNNNIKIYKNNFNKVQINSGANIETNIFFPKYKTSFSIPVEFFNCLGIGAPKFILKYGHFNDCPKILKIIQNIIIHDAKRIHILGINSDGNDKFYSIDRSNKYFSQDKYGKILLFLILTTYYNNIPLIIL